MPEPGPPSSPQSVTVNKKRWLRIAETLAVALCGGLPLGWLGLPAGYLSGAMVAVAIASLLGRRLFLPMSFAHITSAVIGTTLGSVVSPDMMHGMGVYAVSLTMLGISTAAVIAACTLYLRVVHKWDTLSAVLAATPGAISQMVVLAVETKSDSIGVSIAQTLRVVLLVALLPVVLAFFGYSIGTGGSLARTIASLPSLALFIPVSLLAGYVLFKLHFPGGWLFGAMFGSGLLHGFGVVEGGLPQPIVSAATIGIGAMAGTRFRGLDLWTFFRYLGAGAGSLAVAILVMAAFLLLDVWIAGVRVQDTAMAFAPGAMDVMMVVALTMHLDPVFVGAHHLLRFLGVSLTMPFLIRAIAPKPSELPETEI